MSKLLFSVKAFLRVKKYLFSAWLVGGISLACGLILASCAASSAVKSAASIDEVNGIKNKLAWIRHNGQSGQTYVVEIKTGSRGQQVHLMSGPNSHPFDGRDGLLSYKDRSGITVVLKGIGENQTIRSNTFQGSHYSGTLLLVGDGVTLVLDNITIKGAAKDATTQGGSGPLISVSSGGTLIMEEGSSIIDGFNRNNGQNGGGVGVNKGGTFHMKGGTIAGNIVIEDAELNKPTPAYGGAVFVSSEGTFTKTGGLIYGDHRKSTGLNFAHPSKVCNLAQNSNNPNFAPPGRGHAVYFATTPATAIDLNIGPEEQLSFSKGQLTQTGGTVTSSGSQSSHGGSRTVKIGNLTWMGENLNIETADSWCYDDDPANCEKYGRLYTWNAAKSACPAGWRLPTRGDWGSLLEVVGANYVAGAKLKSKTGWSEEGNGTDEFGFAGLPGGSRGPDGSFSNIESDGYWWTSTADGSSFISWCLQSRYDHTGPCGPSGEGFFGLSVRCVR